MVSARSKQQKQAGRAVLSLSSGSISKASQPVAASAGGSSKHAFDLYDEALRRSSSQNTVDLYERAVQKGQNKKTQGKLRSDALQVSNSQPKQRNGRRKQKRANATPMDVHDVNAKSSTHAAGPGSNSKSVEEYLRKIDPSLVKHATALRKEEVDVGVLQTLTENDLRSIGIPLGARKKILQAIEQSR